ncbi:MAG: ABC transporter permease [Verrucomicrobiia bacterium]
MTFLPIVARELRVAARRPSTFRTRTWFVVLTSLIAALLLLVGSLGGGGQVGSELFPVLTALGMLYCLMAGVRYAADSLSEEKREGTLGLLFLTDLRGYDVVLGKLISISTRTFQGLLALVPVLAIGLLIGGVTAGEFWRAAAVLVNTLFFSLSVGLWISALSKESHIAMAATFLTLLALVLLPFAGEWLMPVAGYRLFGPASFLSPVAAERLMWDTAYQASPMRFWSAFGANHLVGWAFLAFASVVLPRSWQDRPPAPAPPARGGRSRLSTRSQGAERRHIARRTRLLDINPIYWLAARHEPPRWLMVGIVIFVGVVAAASISVGHLFSGRFFGTFPALSLLLGLALKVWVAWRACATLAEARRTGAVELLLATPLKVNEIIRGHWEALERFFRWPVVIALVVGVLPVLEGVLFEFYLSPGANLTTVSMLATVFNLATFVLDLLALVWVGMWMGLSQPRAIQAFAKTLVFVVVIPAFIFCLPNLLFDLFWIAWARRKLEGQFRAAAAGRYAPVVQPLEWLRPPPIGTAPAGRPPVLSA